MRSSHCAAWSRRHPHWRWISVAAVTLCGLATGHPAAAALPAEPVRVHAVAVTSPDAVQTPRIRLAQSSGVLDGLFSIFKPKPKAQRPPDSPVTIRKSRTGSTRLPLAEGTATLGADPDPAPILVRPAARPRVSGGSRTMCVRLCDGYYWPVNSGTHTSSIAQDQNTCEQSCQVETKLFIRPSLGADAADMRDLSGKPYRKLKTAFLYRKTYLPECKCRPDPWSASEQMRHEEYRAAATGTLIGPTAAASTGNQDLALSEAISPSEGTASDLDLATGEEASDDSAGLVAAAPEIVSTPAPQTVSMPATTTKLLPKLPAVKKSKPKSTATLAASPNAPAKQTKPASNVRRAAIGRTVR